MSPLLIAALARPICLPISILAGPSCIVFIAVLVLAMLADVHFIIAADAGDRAKAENIAAAIKIAFMKNLLVMRPAYCQLSRPLSSTSNVSGRSSFYVLQCNDSLPDETRGYDFSAWSARRCCP